VKRVSMLFGNSLFENFGIIVCMAQFLMYELLALFYGKYSFLCFAFYHFLLLVIFYSQSAA
jgi:hypothetical protein